MSDKKLSPDQIHAVAAHLTVAEIIIQTGLSAEVQPEERRYRLRVGGKWASGGLVGGKLVQVFASRSGDWSLTDTTKRLVDGTEAVVFVDLRTPREFYPVPAVWFHDDVGARNQDSRQHSVCTQHLEQWRNQWVDVFQELML